MTFGFIYDPDRKVPISPELREIISKSTWLIGDKKTRQKIRKEIEKSQEKC